MFGFGFVERYLCLELLPRDKRGEFHEDIDGYGEIDLMAYQSVARGMCI